MLLIFGGGSSGPAPVLPSVASATLDELKARIIAETNRDDLADEASSILQSLIQSSFDYYAAERFWFNEARDTSTCTPNNQYVSPPTDLRALDRAFLIVGNIRYPLSKMETWDIEELYSTPIVGQPTSFAMFGPTARLWPTPGVAYQVVWLYVADIAAMDYTDGNATNLWLAYAYDLIVARVKIYLYRDYLSALETDPRLSLAMAQEKSAYDRLKGESNRRISTGKVRASW